MIPGTSEVDFAFKTLDIDVVSFDRKLVSEKLLSDAISFSGSNKMAFIALSKAKGTTSSYLTWQKNNYFSLSGRDYGFRLNHYIYYMANNLTRNDIKDFIWALKEDEVRSKIYYDGVTAESKTRDLMTYRREWVYYENNQEYCYMTFRDYQEWINVYAYGDDYKNERGELLDGVDDVDNPPKTGWLTIETYAVWKRMEKYENNVEYVNKSGETSGALDITTPIYNRKISTTVFPKIYRSGNGADGKEPTLPSKLSQNAATWYAWEIKTGKNEISNYQQRAWCDRYEYNEKYKEIDLGTTDRSKYNKGTFIIDEVTSVETGEGDNRRETGAITTKYAQLYIPYNIFEQAVKKIKAVYLRSDGMTVDQGFYNYMKYWAKNGEPNWICSLEEYPVDSANGKSGIREVKYTYLSREFWNKFDGTKDPFGDPVAGKCVGW